jgi:selenocysteine-specific elongation factor
MPREELRVRIGLPPRRVDAVLTGLALEGTVTLVGSRVGRPGFEPTWTEADGLRLAELRRRFQSSPFTPPSIRESRDAVGDELWILLVSRGEFVEVSEEVVFEAEAYRQIVAEVTRALAAGESVTVAQVRDRFKTSRKYALALLEHLDAIGVTVRVGDARRLKGSLPQNPGSPPG